MSIKDRIKAVRGKRSQSAFGDIFGVTPQAISQWENGKTEPSRENLEILAKKEGLNLNWLLNGEVDESTKVNDTMPQPEAVTAYVEASNSRVEAPLGERDLPVFAAVEAGDGDLMVSTDPVDYVERPWFLGEVKEGYGVIVTGESMIPAYDPGDIAIVNPKIDYLRGKVHVFTCESENSHFRAAIKLLVKVTDNEWVVEQYNPPKQYSLPKSIWTHARRVVGKYNC